MMRATIRKRDSFKGEAELLDFARSYLRNAFPNPQRRGCPSGKELRSLVIQPVQSDPAVFEHLTHCSPCLSEYMIHLDRAKCEMTQRLTISRRIWGRSLVAAFGVVVVFIIGVEFYVNNVGSRAQLHRRTLERTSSAQSAAPIDVATRIAIDLGRASPTRGAERNRMAPQAIPPDHSLELTLHMPIGSHEGLYAVILTSGQSTVWSTTARTSWQNQDLFLQVHADFSQLRAGKYDLQVVSDGSHLGVPIVIKVARRETKNKKHEN